MHLVGFVVRMCGVLNEIYIFKTLELFEFLGPFAKLRKATINFVMSVRLSVPVEQLGYH